MSKYNFEKRFKLAYETPSNPIESLLIVVLAIALFALFILYFYWAYALALCWLWYWFAVLPFGMPHLTLFQAVGVLAIVWFLNPSMTNFKYKAKDEEEGHENNKGLLNAIIRPWVTIGVGYCVFQFMQLWS